MGQSESTLSLIEGLQVSRVHHGSPAFEAGLVPYFDFINAVDGTALEADNYSFFYDYVKKKENQPVKFRVFNIRIRCEREVTLTPRDWSGNRSNGIVGFNVSWESVEKAIESTWHITHVSEGSPAHRAELMATRDYLLGMQLPADFTNLTVFKDSSEFHTRLEEWRMVQEAIAIQKPGSRGSLLMLVFDSMDNAVKEIIVETRSPDESLGIEVANGYLHVVPPTPGSHSVPRLARCVVAKAPNSSATASASQQQQQQRQQQQPVVTGGNNNNTSTSSALPQLPSAASSNPNSSASSQPSSASNLQRQNQQQQQDQQQQEADPFAQAPESSFSSTASSSSASVGSSSTTRSPNQQQQQHPPTTTSGIVPPSVQQHQHQQQIHHQHQQQIHHQHQQHQHQQHGGGATTFPPPPPTLALQGVHHHQHHHHHQPQHQNQQHQQNAQSPPPSLPPFPSALPPFPGAVGGGNSIQSHPH